jgi:hypothetical protein
MKSIFDLKTKNSELSSANQGLSNYKFQEVQSLRSIVGSNFPDGEIVFRWTYGSSKYWIPNKSYLKIRLALTNSNGSRIQVSDAITYAMNTVPLLFQASQYKISDMTVCSITQNLPQIDTLKNRMYKSDAWLQSIGQSNNNWCHSYAKRERNMFMSGGHNINFLNPYRRWSEILADASIIVTNTVSVLPSDTGEYKMTFAVGTPNLTLIKGLQVGDIVEYQTIDDATTNRRLKSAGVITKIETLVITFLPFLNAHQQVAIAVTPGLFEMNLHRHDFYDEDYSQNAQEVELIWFPTLSIFDSVKHAIPCGSTKQEFTLTPFPDTVYQKNAIESRKRDVNNSLTGGDDTFLLTVKDMRFYILTCDSNKIQDNFDFMLDLNEIQCQSTPITSIQQQQSLDVISSTNGITLAFQDSAVLNNSLYSMTKFKIRDEIELNLTRYYIRYSGQVPQPDFEGELKIIGTGNTALLDIGKRDRLKDIYNRTKIYDGTFFTEQPESLEVYRSRGMYIYHPFPKTASSKNTRVYVQVNFSSLNDSEGAQQQPFLLLFSHYKKAVVLNVSNGRIIGVQPYNA